MKILTDLLRERNLCQDMYSDGTLTEKKSDKAKRGKIIAEAVRDVVLNNSAVSYADIAIALNQIWMRPFFSGILTY